jgi:hypothetical protein
MPKIHAPRGAIGEVTGSVAMKTAPNMSPPEKSMNRALGYRSGFTRCMMPLKMPTVRTIEAGMRQSKVRRKARKSPARMMMAALVSPRDPATFPRKRSMVGANSRANFIRLSGVAVVTASGGAWKNGTAKLLAWIEPSPVGGAQVVMTVGKAA